MTDVELVIAEDIVHTEVDHHAMLMSIEEGKYYSLSPVATRIWALLEAPITVPELVKRLLEDYEVSPDDCLSDVQIFVDALRERRLIRQK